MRRRKLNLKFLVWLGVGCSVLVVAVFFLHRYQVRRTARNLLALALKAEQEGDLTGASELLQRYLNLNREDYPSFATLAKLLARLPDQVGTDHQELGVGYAVLESTVLKVPPEAPEHEQIRRCLVDFTTHDRIRQYKASLDHLAVLLQRHPDDVQLSWKYGQALLGALEYDSAREVFSQLIGLNDRGGQQFQLDPNQVDFNQVVPNTAADAPKLRALAQKRWGKGVHQIDAYVELARILKQHGKAPELADRVMDRLVEMNGESYRAYLERGRYRFLAYLDTKQDQDLAAAKVDLAKARELRPDDADVILSSASLALEEQDFEAAKKHLEAGLQKYPKDDRMYISIADVASRQGDPQAALAHIQRGLDTLPGDLRLLRVKADTQLRSLDIKAVKETIAEMRRVGVRPEGLADLEARILLVERNWPAAAKKLEEVRPVLTSLPGPAARVDLLLGQCYEQMGQYDRAKDAYDRAVLADPTSDEGRAARVAFHRVRQLAEGRLAVTPDADDAGQPPAERPVEEEWQALLAKLSEDATEADKQLLKSNLLLQREEYNQARDLLGKARAADPKNARLWAASIQLALRDPEQGLQDALQLLREAQEQLGDNESFRMTAEQVHVAYVDWLASDPKRGGADKAKPLLAAAEQEFGDTTLIRLAKIKLLAAEGSSDLADQLHQLEQGIDGRPEGEQLLFWSNVWLQYYQHGLRDDARRCLQRLAQLQPNNLKIQTMLFDLALEMQDNESMQKAIADIRALGDETGWRRCEAARLVFRIARGQQDKSALADAQRLIDEVKQARPDWNEVYRLQAEIDLLNDNQEAAVANFQRSFELGPPNVIAVRKVHLLLSRMGRHGEAQKVLGLLGDEQRASVVPEQQVENLMRTGKTAAALQMAQTAVDADSANPMKHLWHGQILVHAKEVAAAVQAFRRAVELAPQQSQAWLALITALALNQEQAAAATELQRAQLHLAADELPLLLAQCSEVLAKPDDAERYYQMACDADPTNLSLQRATAAFYLGPHYTGNDKNSKARRHLNEILRHGKNTAEAADPNVAWARRMAARLLAASGQYADIQKAIELIQQNHTDRQLGSTELLEMARILANRPEPVSRQRTTELLEQLRERGELAANEQLILAQLYHRAGQWPACRSLMDDLIAQNSSDYRIWAVYSVMLLDRGDLSQAARRIAQLESLDPNNTATKELQASLLAKQGQPQEAVATLKQILPAAPTRKDVPTLLRVAGLLGQIKQYDQAEQVFRQAAELEPRTRLQLATFLGRYGDLNEAFKMLDAARGTRSDLAALSIAVDCVNRRRHEVGNQYDPQLEAWFERLVRANPGARPLQMQLAQFRDGQGRYDDVEQIYRQLLDQRDLTAGPERAAVLNNLAYTLALQGAKGNEGMTMINEAIKLVGPAAEVLDTRAMVKLSLGDVQGALEDLKLALITGRSALKLLHLALAELAADDKPSARKTLEEAQQLGLDEDGIGGLEREKYQQLMRQLGISQARRGVNTGLTAVRWLRATA